MEIQINSQIHGELVTLVDNRDFLPVAVFKWSVRSNNGHLYAVRRIGRKYIYLHRFIMGPVPRGFVVDHINGNGLDNRRSNLRVVTKSENYLNSNRSRNASARAIRRRK